ncbi:hypothetical protein ASZ78_012329, partial [Callipepla squamata]
LPSDPFKYLSWYDIEEHDVRGSQLHCPRVREGKEQKDKLGLKPRLCSNSELLNELNLSFQDLGDLYQVENFRRILQRLIRVEKLWLVDSSLTDLSAIRLPR